MAVWQSDSMKWNFSGFIFEIQKLNGAIRSVKLPFFKSSQSGTTRWEGWCQLKIVVQVL